MDCLHKWKSSSQETLEQKQYTTNCAQGIIGGALALPIVLATMFFDIPGDLAGLSGMLLPIGIFFGWKLFRGKHSRAVVIFTMLYALSLGTVSAAVNTYRLGFELLSGSFALQLLARWSIIAFGYAGIYPRISMTDKKVIAMTKSIFDDATPLSQLTNKPGKQ